MRNATAIAISCLLLLLAGCAEAPPRSSAAGQIAQKHHISFPKSPVAYTALYTLNENGGEAQKRVVADGDKMKIQLGSIAIYFLSDRAYSCSYVGGNASCFDITAKAEGMKLDEVYPCQHLEGAREAEPVDIGGTAGRCYLLPYGVAGSRKICCTDRGVLAYDQYNLTSKSMHTEYLTEISYEADYREFLLPAEPAVAPEGLPTRA